MKKYYGFACGMKNKQGMVVKISFRSVNHLKAALKKETGKEWEDFEKRGYTIVNLQVREL